MGNIDPVNSVYVRKQNLGVYGKASLSHQHFSLSLLLSIKNNGKKMSLVENKKKTLDFNKNVIFNMWFLGPEILYLRLLWHPFPTLPHLIEFNNLN